MFLSTNRLRRQLFRGLAVIRKVEPFLASLVLSDKPSYRIGRHLLFWTLCTLFFGTIYGGITFFDSRLFFHPIKYVEAVLYLPLHIFLSYGIIYFLFPRYLLPGKYFPLVAGIVLLIFITAFLNVLFLEFMILPFRQWMGEEHRDTWIVYSLMAGLRGTNTVAGFAAAIKLVKSWYFKKVENEILEKEKLKAELDVLKAQLQPHFLFNTLNNLYSLILQKSSEASHVVIKLSALLHYILAESSRNKIPLTKELALLQDYVALEQIRFGKRLDLTINMTGNFERKVIAPLILLPFVENAFKHGVNEVLEHPWVSLDISVRENQLKFKLINGKLATSLHQAPYSTGIGLQNVRKRLDLLYPNNHVLRTQDEDESFVINLQMELENE